MRNGEKKELSLRERKQRQTRRSIHEAALELTEEKGFAGFTLDELAERANISRRTFFNYFPAKEDAVINAQDRFIPEDIKENYLAGAYSESVSFVEELVLMVQDATDQLLQEFSATNMRRLKKIFASEPRLITLFMERAERDRAEITELLQQRYLQLGEERAEQISDIFFHIHSFAFGRTLKQGLTLNEHTFTDAYRGFRDLGFGDRTTILK